MCLRRLVPRTASEDPTDLGVFYIPVIGAYGCLVDSQVRSRR
jgi:hypothetical protein